MNPSSISPIALGAYNPSQVPKSVLLAEFTARRGMMDDLLSVMRGNEPDHPCQHSLLIGPRGFGKTTSLYALKYRLEDDPQLAEKWVPLLFDEENYHLGDLAGFWLECLRLAEIALQRKGINNYASLHTSRDPKLEEQACDAFLSLLDAAKRRALLLVDNLNDVLDAVADDAAQHRLRAFLLEESRVCLVGTACSYFEAISSTDRPFYQLFRVFRLDSFTVSEMKDALKAMAAARPNPANVIQWPTQEGYWKGLHILTGGNPRLVKIIYQLMERGVTPDFQSQLEGLLDAYTPYFKHRIESMSPQQRRVFDAIALAWDAVQISDIAPGLRMESNQISAQIKALTDAQLIAVRGGSAKRKTYQVADRFSNIYYFMRFSRAGRSKFEWFIRTMKIILTPDQYSEQIERMREQSMTCSVGDGQKLQVHLLATAMQLIEDESLRREEGHKSIERLLSADQSNALHELLADPATKEVLADDYDVVSFVSKLPKTRLIKLGFQPKSADWWSAVSADLMRAKNPLLAISCLARATELEPSNERHWFMLGAVQLVNKFTADAESTLQIGLLKAKAGSPTRNLMAALLVGTIAQTQNRIGEARQLAVSLILSEPSSEGLTLGFELVAITNVDACKAVLMKAIESAAHGISSAVRASTGQAPLSFALDVLATLIASGCGSEVLPAIEASESKEALEVALHAIRLRTEPNLRERLAPERAALAEAYLDIIEKRKCDIAVDEMNGGRPFVRLASEIFMAPQSKADTGSK